MPRAMYRRRPLWTIVVLAALPMGCGSGTSRIALRVDQTPSDTPAAYARLRAIALDTNGIPLPVSLERLRESKPTPKASAITDKSGAATLALHSSQPYLIEVIPWHPTGGEGTGPVGAPQAWVYDPKHRALSPWPQSPEGPLTLTLVRGR